MHIFLKAGITFILPGFLLLPSYGFADADIDRLNCIMLRSMGQSCSQKVENNTEKRNSDTFSGDHTSIKYRDEYLNELKKQNRSYTKISYDGKKLPDNAKSWSCVRDNNSGLVWEVKSTDGGIHDRENIYRWGGKGASNIALGYNAGKNKREEFSLSSFFVRRNQSRSSWNVLIDGSNQNNFCGFNDWRIPDLYELRSFVFCSSNQGSPDKDGCTGRFYTPAIAKPYFPNAQNGWHWSGSHTTWDYKAWLVNFSQGVEGYNRTDFSEMFYLRLVRSDN